MGSKIGFFQKIRIAAMYVVDSKKHNLAVSCEFCNSTNITASDQEYNEESAIKIYRAIYTCQNCKATAFATQRWVSVGTKEEDA